VTLVIGLADRIDYVHAHQAWVAGHMQDTKDKRKSVPDHAETQSLDEQVLDMASGDNTQRVRKLKRDALQNDGTTAALRQQLSELDERLENVADSMEKHGYTEVLANRLKKLEQDREAVAQKLKTTELGSLDELPDIVPEQLRAYRDKVAALATPDHGLTAQQLVNVRGLIDEIVGPIPVGPGLIARMTMRSMVAGGACSRLDGATS
jgi:chromosome segregation ATPase